MSETGATTVATRRCSVCAAPRRRTVEAQLEARVPLRRIADEHDLSKDAIARHRDRCPRVSASGVGPDGAWTPAFPGQRPPFQPGHTLSMRHGAFSAARVEPLAESMVLERLEDTTTVWLQQPAYRPALLAWARTESRILLLDAWLSRHVQETEGCVSCKECSPVADALLKFEKSAMNHRTRLGLDPMSRARLGRDIATGQQASMATLLAQLAAERQQGDTDDDH